MHVVISFSKKYYKLKTIFTEDILVYLWLVFWSIKNAELILYRLVFVSHIPQI